MTATTRTLAYLRISLDSERSGSIEKQRARLRADETAKDRDPDAITEYIDQVSADRVPYAAPDVTRCCATFARVTGLSAHGSTAWRAM